MECTHTETVTDLERGETVCATCGEVIHEYISDEGHSGDTQHGPSGSYAFHDKGLATKIGNNRDSTGQGISLAARRDFHRLRKWDTRTRTSAKENSLLKAFMMLQSAQAKLGLPENVTERSAMTYRQIVDARLTMGRTITSLLGVAIYIACRECDVPRTLDDIAVVVGTARKTLYRDLSVVLQKLNVTLPTHNTVAHITRVCNNMKLSERVKRQALDILGRAKKNAITAGKKPNALAGASIYVAALLCGNEGLTQRIVAKESGVTDVTVRAITKILCEELNIPLFEIKVGAGQYGR